MFVYKNIVYYILLNTLDNLKIKDLYEIWIYNHNHIFETLSLVYN